MKLKLIDQTKVWCIIKNQKIQNFQKSKKKNPNFLKNPKKKTKIPKKIKIQKFQKTKKINNRISGERHTTSDLKKYPSRVVAYPSLFIYLIMQIYLK